MSKTLSCLLLLIITTAVVSAKDININSIVKSSVESKKHLFIFLHRTDCGYCESMLTFTLDDDPVRELIEGKFAYLSINISENDRVTYKNFIGNGRDFAKYVGYNIYPSSLFLNKKSEIVYAISGYQDKEQFLDVLKYVDSRAYKTIGFQTFKKKNKQSK